MNNLRFIDAFNGAHTSRLQAEPSDEQKGLGAGLGSPSSLRAGVVDEGRAIMSLMADESARADLEGEVGDRKPGDAGAARDADPDNKIAAPAGRWRRQAPPDLSEELAGELKAVDTPARRAALESERLKGLREFFKGSGHEAKLEAQLNAARSQRQLRAALRPDPPGSLHELIAEVKGVKRARAGGDEDEEEKAEAEADRALRYCTDLYVLMEREAAQSTERKDEELAEHVDSKGRLKAGKLKINDKAKVSYSAVGGSEISFSPDMSDLEIREVMALQELAMRAQGKGNEEETLDSTDKPDKEWTPPMFMASMGQAKMYLGLPAHFGKRFDPHSITSPLNRAVAHNTGLLMELDGCLRTSSKYFNPSVNMATGVPNAAFARMRADLFCMVHTMDLSGDLSKKLIDKCTGPAVIVAMVGELKQKEAERKEAWQALVNEKEQWNRGHKEPETWDQKRQKAEEMKGQAEVKAKAAEAKVKTAEAKLKNAEAKLKKAAEAKDDATPSKKDDDKKQEVDQKKAIPADDGLEGAKRELAQAASEKTAAEKELADEKAAAVAAGSEAARYPDLARVIQKPESKMYFVEKTATVNGKSHTYLEELTDPKEIMRRQKDDPNSLFTRDAPHPGLLLKLAAENDELMKDVAAVAFRDGGGKALKDLYDVAVTAPPPESVAVTQRAGSGFRAGAHWLWRHMSPLKYMKSKASGAYRSFKDSTSQKFLASMTSEHVGALMQAYATDTSLTAHERAAKQLSVLRDMDDPSVLSWTMQAHFKEAVNGMDDPALLAAVYMNGQKSDSRLNHSLEKVAESGGFKGTEMESFFRTRGRQRRLRADDQVLDITPAEQKAIYLDKVYENSVVKPAAGLREQKPTKPMSYEARRLAFQMEFLRTQAMAQPLGADGQPSFASLKYKAAQDALRKPTPEGHDLKDADMPRYQARLHIQGALGRLAASATAAVVRDLAGPDEAKDATAAVVRDLAGPDEAKDATAPVVRDPTGPDEVEAKRALKQTEARGARVMASLDKQLHIHLADAAYDATLAEAKRERWDIRSDKFEEAFEARLCASVGVPDLLPKAKSPPKSGEESKDLKEEKEEEKEEEASKTKEERSEIMQRAMGNGETGKAAVDDIRAQFAKRRAEDGLKQAREAKAREALDKKSEKKDDAPSRRGSMQLGRGGDDD